MSIMPQHVQDAVDALAPFRPDSAEQARSMLLFWVRRAELTDAELDRAAEAAADREEQRLLSCCPDWRTVDHSRHDARATNADYRDGYAAGYVDCARVKTQMDLERSRPAGSLEESRDRLVESSLSALVTVGMLSKESASALVSLWYRRDCLTPVELDALRVAAGPADRP